MRSPEELTSEYSYCDPTTHLFYGCQTIQRHTDDRLLGVYRQRIDACNMKLRYAAQAYLELLQIINELEYGEFIYFDDHSRLKAGFHFEALIIFLRASLDLAVSAFCIYFSGTTGIDSTNDFLKRLSKHRAWIPAAIQPLWDELDAARQSEAFHWIHALLGRDSGMSLRDIAVHRSMLEIDTFIDDRDRGRFYIVLSKSDDGDARFWLKEFYTRVADVIDEVGTAIVLAEVSLANGNSLSS